MSSKLLVVGTDYMDYRDFVGGRIGRKGGIHNFMRAYPDCDHLVTDYRKCWFKPHNGKMVKTNDHSFGQVPNIELPERDIHFCYGDSIAVFPTALQSLPKLSSSNFISVDLIDPFEKQNMEVLEFWAKYANYIFVATEREIMDIPRIVQNSKALWIFHNPKWVITMCGNKPPLRTENPYYEEFVDTIGAGDYFAGCILRRLFDETGTIDELEACKEVASMLRTQNEVQYGDTAEW